MVTIDMATGSSHFVDYVLEQLAPLRGAVSSRFFGGTGLSSEGTQFAMVMGSELYFVVDDATRPNYERMGSSCFSYSTKKKRVDVRKYYAVPAGMIEDQEELVALARESIRVANSAKKIPMARSKKTSSKPSRTKQVQARKKRR
jgi:DNA transformation protein